MLITSWLQNGCPSSRLYSYIPGNRNEGKAVPMNLYLTGYIAALTNACFVCKEIEGQIDYWVKSHLLPVPSFGYTFFHLLAGSKGTSLGSGFRLCAHVNKSLCNKIIWMSLGILFFMTSLMVCYIALYTFHWHGPIELNHSHERRIFSSPSFKGGNWDHGSLVMCSTQALLVQ